MKPFVNCALYLIIMQIIIQSIFKEHFYFISFFISFCSHLLFASPSIHPNRAVLSVRQWCSVRLFRQAHSDKLKCTQGTATPLLRMVFSFVHLCRFIFFIAIIDSVCVFLLLPQEAICCVLLWYLTFYSIRFGWNWEIGVSVSVLCV